jgi:hypothetical protein
MEWLSQYGYMIIGIWLALGFFIAIVFFIRSNPPTDKKKIGIGWYLLLGPFALIKWHAQRNEKNELLSRREVGGWIAVVGLVVAVILWKFVSKTS